MLELYAGVGGLAHALEPARAARQAEVVAAVDQSPLARAAYRSAHSASDGAPEPINRRVEDLSPRELKAFDADLWWASPPCQPFTGRGRQRDLDDPRARTFRALLERIEAVKPSWLVLENVAGFAESRAHALLDETLRTAGYRHRHEEILCPSSLGAPNRRPRFYAVASRREAFATPPDRFERRDLRPTVASCLEPQPHPNLSVEPEQLERYPFALDLVDPHDPDAVTACFTSAYGRSIVRSGSYLRTRDGGVRRVSPLEVSRLLGFPRDPPWAVDLPSAKAWRLAGNSLAIDAVRHVLARVPALEALRRRDRREATGDEARPIIADRR